MALGLGCGYWYRALRPIVKDGVGLKRFAVKAGAYAMTEGSLGTAKSFVSSRRFHQLLFLRELERARSRPDAKLFQNMPAVHGDGIETPV